MIRYILEGVGEGVILFLRSMRCLPSLPRQGARFLDYSVQIGYSTGPIVGIMSFFIGAVLALQGGYAMAQISGLQDQFLGPLVGLSAVRELAPVMVAFLVAGRVGSAITAELASMKVYDEINALKTMKISPEKILVMPRLVAAFAMTPFLAILGIMVAWWGGEVIAATTPVIDVPANVFWSTLKEQVGIEDLIDGLIKTQVFVFLVILIACNEGMRTTGGPREIGNAVTRSVVAAMVTVLLTDYFITKILM